MVRDGLLIFNSVHKVMRAEKILKRAGLDVRVVPVPRQLSSDCGLSLAFRVEEAGAIKAELAAGEIAPVGIYRLVEGDYVEV